MHTVKSLAGAALVSAAALAAVPANAAFILHGPTVHTTKCVFTIGGFCPVDRLLARSY